MVKIKKTNPVLQRNGVKNVFFTVNQQVIYFSLTAMSFRGRGKACDFLV